MEAAIVGDHGHQALAQLRDQVGQRRARRQRLHIMAHRAVDAVLEVARVHVHLREQVGLVQQAHQLPVLEHRQLRDLGLAHAREGGGQRVLGADADDGAVFRPPRDQVAQVALALALEQALVEHPRIVVDLGEVAGARVADQRHHALGRGLRAAVLQRRGQQRAGGRARQDALGAVQVARGGEALLVGDRVGVAHAAQVRDRRHEVLADALDGPGAGLAEAAGLDEVLEDGAGRIGQHHVQARPDLGEEARQAGDRAAGADAADQRVDPVADLLPDLRTGGGLVRERVVGVVELVGVPGAGEVPDQARGAVLVVVGVALADVGAGDVHLGAERLELQHLLGRHLVRHDQHDPVALRPRDQREPEPGIAGRGLDDGAAGREQAVAFGRLDHRQADAVLDRAAGVLRFQLQEELAGAGVEPVHRHQRRVADQVQHGGAVGPLDRWRRGGGRGLLGTHGRSL